MSKLKSTNEDWERGMFKTNFYAISNIIKCLNLLIKVNKMFLTICLIYSVCNNMTTISSKSSISISK